MPQMPKRVKFRKFQRGKLRGKASRCNYVSFGEFGLQAMEVGWITAEQLEAGRVAVGHFLQGEGNLVIRVFPHKSVTKKPAEVRMGTGKGEPAHWVAEVKPGTVMFEISGVPEDLAKEALARIAHRMPIRTKLAHRRVKV
jgi:large subunit ribosomal protein L16